MRFYESVCKHRYSLVYGFYCRLKLQLGFLRALCKGLFRDQHTVSQHSKHVLDPLCISNGQKYAVEDLHRLKCLVDLHGHNWKKIAKLTERYVYLV